MGSRFFAFVTAFSAICYIHASDVKVTITPSNSPIFFIDGKRLTMTCTVHGDKHAEITWRKMELPLNADEYQIDEWEGQDGHTPTRSVRVTKNVAGQNDVAEFRCSAGGTDQMFHTSSFYVFTRDANVTEGSLTTLTCKPEMTYSDKTVTWYKGAVPLTEIPDLKGRLEITNDTVSFRNTKLTDSGVYTCRLEIGPTKEISQVFEEKVVLQGKPYIGNWNNPELNQNVTNTSIVLKCPAGGYPVPEVFWFLEGEVLESSDRIHVTEMNGQASGQLEVINSTQSDLGQYSCTAENVLGKASFTFDLKGSAQSSSGFKGVVDVSSMITYISIVAIATWTR